ncbi:MAG: DUF4349 domain-containing protein [Chitinophagaceae bacterium]|nr:MAG: DUF4349 domain-containing protein [Chitinophagaceae bacterium]
MRKMIFATVVLLTLASCGPNDNAKLTVAELSAETGVPLYADRAAPKVDQVKFPPPLVEKDAVTVVEKKIIKEGDIRFEARNVNATRKNILNRLAKADGYVNEDNESVNGEENRKEYTLVVRIPAKNFDNFLGAVSESAAKIDAKNISVSDVTTDYIDIKTRLDNNKLLEKRYLELLSKAGKMSDVLEIEEKLSEIRSEIESTQGQLNYMDKQVTYSSLSITFYTKQAGQVTTGNGFGYKFKQALGSGLEFLQNLFFGIISMWPLWIIVVVLYWLIRTWVRRNRKS